MLEATMRFYPPALCFVLAWDILQNPPAPACQGHPAVKIRSCLLSRVTSLLLISLQLQVCCSAVCLVCSLLSGSLYITY